MMIPQSIFITCIVIISISSLSEIKSSKSSTTIGFTTDLIHRDSPLSPYYDPSLSPSQRLANSIQRSYNRLHRFSNKSKKSSPVAEIKSYIVEYLMSYLIGTPPVPSLGIADTGSDLIWTQCALCDECMKQRFPLFNPEKSQTYRPIPCNSSICNTNLDAYCDASQKHCQYSYTYGDGSGTYGVLARDTLTLGSTTGKTVSFPNVAFGCGLDNSLVFNGVESGIVGLGGGQGSLISQLGSSIRGKLAYCLVSYSSNTTKSKLHFGDNAVVSGRDVVSTPLVRKDPLTFYYVTLEGISVGNQRVEINIKDSSGSAKEGNMFIDSGTTFTFIPDEFYSKLDKALENVVKLKRDPEGKMGLNSCWFAERNDGLPTITMHFTGADLVLDTENAFYRVSREVICLAMLSASEVHGHVVYGNLAQMNYLIGFDLQKKTVSFQRRDCTKY